MTFRWISASEGLGGFYWAQSQKNAVVTKMFAPKFCAEWSNREVHSSHGDHFRDHFWTIGGSGDCKIRSGNPGVWPICDKILYAARPDPVIFCMGFFGRVFDCNGSGVFHLSVHEAIPFGDPRGKIQRIRTVGA